MSYVIHLSGEAAANWRTLATELPHEVGAVGVINTPEGVGALCLRRGFFVRWLGTRQRGFLSQAMVLEALTKLRGVESPDVLGDLLEVARRSSAAEAETLAAFKAEEEAMPTGADAQARDIYTTSKGIKVPIRDMQPGHVENAIAKIIRTAFEKELALIHDGEEVDKRPLVRILHEEHAQFPILVDEFVRRHWTSGPLTPEGVPVASFVKVSPELVREWAEYLEEFATLRDSRPQFHAHKY